MLEHTVWAIISDFFWVRKCAGLVFGVCVLIVLVSMCVCIYIYMSDRIRNCGPSKGPWEGCLVPAHSNFEVSQYLCVSAPNTGKLCECVGICRNAGVVSALLRCS